MGARARGCGLRGRLIEVLWRTIIDADESDDLTVAAALTVPARTQAVSVQDLTARKGRRLLAGVASLDEDMLAVTVTHPHGPVNRTGFVGDSVHWFPTPAGSACRAA